MPRLLPPRIAPHLGAQLVPRLACPTAQRGPFVAPTILRAALGVALLGGLVLAAPAAAEGFVDLEVGSGFDDNHNRARPRDEQRADGTVGAKLTGGWRFEVGTASSFSLSAGVEGTTFARFGRLDTVDGIIGAAWRSKFGLGPSAPTLRIAAEVRRQDSRSALRSGTSAAASLRLGRRFADRVDVALAYVWEDRDADDPTFDHRAQSLLLSAGLDVGETSTLTFRYQGRKGDVTSVSAPNAVILAAAEVRATDDAYDEPGWIAYRLDATTHVFGLGLATAITERASFDVRFERQLTDTEADGLSYDNNVLRLGLRVGW